MNSTIYSPMPEVLTYPERLVELNTLMSHVTSGCRVIIPASARPIMAVHGGYFSSRKVSQQAVQVMVTEGARMLSKEWFYQVWTPLHLAVIERDTEGLFSAEVNLVRRELDRSVSDMTDCQCWASLVSLSFYTCDDIGTRAFRAARVVSHYFSQKEARNEMPDSNQEWEKILFSSGQNGFPDGWLESFIHRAKHVFTCAKRQRQSVRQSGIPAEVLSVQKHRYASGQSYDHIQGGNTRTVMNPDAPDGEKSCVQGKPLFEDPIFQSYPVQSIGPVEEE